ncbi:50S ribosomal protein L25 [Candidatus Falkowbacteria bacterium]|nr:50S ribosomal protein L25 [Candidatus Falkowbacteria bacterium]
MVHELKGKLRQAQGKKLIVFRQKGEIPGIVYGQGMEKNILIFLNGVAFNKVFDAAGGSAVVSLLIEGEEKPRDVLIKEISRDPVRDTINHVDFYQFKEGQKLEVDIRIKLVGVAPAVKDLQGILVQNIDNIAVRCLPKDIVSEVEVDVSSLKTLEDKILVKDVKFPASFEVMDNPEEVVAMISVPEEEKEEAPAAAVPAEGAAATPAEGVTTEADKKSEKKVEKKTEKKE